MSNAVTLEQVEELYSVLRGGDLPDGWGMDEQPNLTDEAAFSVIWFLQERLRIIPNHYEQCFECHELCDSHDDGFYVDGTDEPDDWHVEIGVTQELLKRHAGKYFCSMPCELAFWDAQKEMSDEQA